MALSITVNGAGIFTASMEEGPVSFSASLGAIGPAGPGVAAGGTTGQILVKTTNADYATGWIDNAARSVFISGRNNTGSTIAKGAVVYLSGATGNKATIALALANSESTSARTIGITKAEVANGADVDVVISGAIENIDTSAFSAGQVVYLSATTAGGLQTTLPTQPNHGVVIGIVTRSNPSNGSIEVTVQNYQELRELSDVLVSNPQDGQALIYETSSGLWKNLAIPAPDLSAYLTSATAAATYQTIAGMSSYLTTSAAASTYAPIASPTFTGTVTIPAGASIDGYLTTASAASTYQPIGSYAVTNDGNTFSASQVIAVNNSTTALRVTQEGTGDALRVEDAANPDSSPFIVDQFGSVILGKTTATAGVKLDVLGNATFSNNNSVVIGVGSNQVPVTVTNNGTGATAVFTNTATATADAVRITNLGTGNSFVVEDSTNPDSSPFVITADGRVGIGTTSVGSNLLTVTGATALSTSGSTPLTISVTNSASGVTGQKIDYRGTGDAFQIANNTTEKFVVDKDGNTEVAGTLKIGTSTALTGVATDAEAVAGTSTTLAVTPSGVKAEGLKATRLAIGTATMISATSGTGAGSAQNSNQRQVTAPTTAAGHATLYYNFLVHPLQGYNSNIDWSKRHEFEFLINKGVNTSDANTVGRLKIGQPSFSGSPGDLSARGVGIRIPGNGNVFLMVHDGTTLTTVDSGIVATGSSMRLILKIVSDGAGNVTLYSSGSQVATTSAGPTSQGGGNGVIYEAQNLATISTTPMQLVFGNFVADFGY